MSNSRDELTGALVGLGATITEAMNEIEGFIPCGNPATITNAGLVILKNPTSEEKLVHQTEATKTFIEHVSEHRGVTAHDVADVSSFKKYRFIRSVGATPRIIMPSGGPFA